MSETNPTLHQQVVLFTGKLASTTRKQAHQWVTEAGGRVVSTISQRVNLVIVGMLGWSVLADGSISQALQQAEKARKKGQVIDIISEQVFLQRIGKVLESHSQQATISKPQAAKQLGIDLQNIQQWEQFGLIRSQQELLSFQDLVSLRSIIRLLQQGLDINTISQALYRINQLMPELAQPLAQTKWIQTQDQQVVLELQGLRMETSGQFLLNFEPTATAQTTVVEKNIENQSQQTLLLFEQGQAFESAQRWQEAEQCYRRVVGLDSNWPYTHFNLGNALREQGRHNDAIIAYREAKKQHKNDSHIAYNLGYCLDELGQLAEACDEYILAIRLRADFLDAIFNLSRCLERRQRHDLALPYWQAYLELDSQSQWARIARRFSKL